MKKLIKIIVLSEILGLLFLPAMVQALSMTFYNITHNSPESAAIGETQARVDVLEVTDSVGPNQEVQVDFRFYQVGSDDMSIEGIYFDDGGLLGIAQIINDSILNQQVSFSQGADPPDLPGGNSVSPAFVTTSGFLADSDAPVQQNGVNPGEEVIIRYNLLSGISYDDIVTNLSTGDPDLRIGIHVIGFANGA